MKLIRKLESIGPALHGGALSIGNFDGVHRGHGQIIERLRFWASQVEGPSIVFTFDPHPVRLLRPELAPPPLTWTERKAELLAEMGVDCLIAYPTDQDLLQLSYNDFFDQIILGHVKARAIIEGPNFYFGHDRLGDVNALVDLCAASGIQCEIVHPIQSENDLISSTRIRQAIGSGDVESAANLLTKPYRIRGMVVHGASRGVELGFPTANLDAIDTLVPKMGVYAGRAKTNDGFWSAAIHIGPSPTFGEVLPKVEVHLIGFDNTLYGQVMEVEFFERLREIQQFASIDDLKSQLQADISKAKNVSTSK